MENYTVKIDEHKTINWYQNDKRHRLDGPAVEHANGNKFWYQNDKLHRTDGPAIEWADGTKFWFLNDKFHRTNGPAVEFPCGAKSWYLNGKLLNETEFNKQTKAVTRAGEIVTIDGKKYTLTEIS